MTPIDHFAHLVRTLRDEDSRQVRQHCEAFIHAESLARLLGRAGMHAICLTEFDDDAFTLILRVEAPPPAVQDALIEGGLSFEALDFYCDFHVTRAYYQVQAFGSSIVILTEVHLVDSEDRAALITPRQKVAA